MDKKAMLQAGFKKATVALVIRTNSYNGKKEYVVVDSIEHAKEFKTSESIQQVTFFYKGDENNG